jgi:hypothetical protein
MRLKTAVLCVSMVVGTWCIVPLAQAQEQIAASMCDYIKADDKNRFRKVLSENRLRLRNIYDGVVCDGLSMVRFAVKSNAAGVGEFIIKQLPASQINSSGDVAWAEANNASSPLVAVLKARASGGGD